MRTYTLVFSIVAHVCAACAVLFTTVLATDELPTPRDGAVFVTVATSPPPAPPPAPRPRADPVIKTDAAPTIAPDGVRPEIERPPIAPFDAAAPDGVVGGIGSDPSTVIRDEPPPPPAPAAAQPPVRVGGVIRPPTRTVYVPPTYPPIALSARVSGYVILEATIGQDGTVRDLRVLKSIPLLDEAAKEAVRQWRFTPTLLNGQPVSVLMTVTVQFNLER
jgi:periplasmic protein TonB